MATKELDILMQRKDANGDMEIHYPITRLENVQGAQEAILALKEVIDAAVSESAPVVGAYTGDGVDGRIITLGFEPIAVEIYDETGRQYSNTFIYGGLALNGYPVLTPHKVPMIQTVPTGFKLAAGVVQIYTMAANYSGTVYHYIAFRG